VGTPSRRPNEAIVEADAELTHPGHHVQTGVAGGSGRG
jgi:hypothetical protein